MLPIDELVRFAAGFDEHHHHPAATAAAEAWGLERPVFVRSSASHVLVARSRGDEGRAVLRLRPDVEPHRSVLARGARAAARWAAAGAPAAPALRSVHGHLVERTGGYAVMAMPAVEGDTLAEQGLPEGSAAWGAALARLHATGPGADDLPHASDALRTPCPDDPALAARAVDLLDALAALPRTPDVHGVLHGDPEADNVVAGADGLVLVDPDEVRVGWYAADVAFALRDWSTPAGGPDLTSEVPQRFIEGYRQVRPLTDDDIARLPLFTRVAAVEELLGLAPQLATDARSDWPTWATDLHARLRRHAAVVRAGLA
ncbi:phosphotransferase [Microbacterium sp. ARD31]|uniref:phosphotransferase enzyme family protein n=1 Tax=Microbacterium sp. ARD31 TaxID=2962576 RepID=UPI002882A315|nr:phosphotransferase [Microbacterium sp. ARD31]MDT0184979.1 phosphotransferase [Microbacterium sp. ARD31]